MAVLLARFVCAKHAQGLCPELRHERHDGPGGRAGSGPRSWDTYLTKYIIYHPYRSQLYKFSEEVRTTTRQIRGPVQRYMEYLGCGTHVQEFRPKFSSLGLKFGHTCGL